MSRMLEKAKAIGAQYALIVKGERPYLRFYKRGNWDLSRNCLLYWNDERRRWDNSSELNFTAIEYGLKVTARPYELIDFEKQSRRSG